MFGFDSVCDPQYYGFQRDWLTQVETRPLRQACEHVLKRVESTVGKDVKRQYEDGMCWEALGSLLKMRAELKRSKDSNATFKEYLARITIVSNFNMAAAAVCQLRLMGERELRCKFRTPEQKPDRKEKFKGTWCTSTYSNFKLPGLWIQHWVQGSYKQGTPDHPHRLQAVQPITAQYTGYTAGYSLVTTGLVSASISLKSLIHVCYKCAL
jgi:hypothetical protein